MRRFCKRSGHDAALVAALKTSPKVSGSSVDLWISVASGNLGTNGPLYLFFVAGQTKKKLQEIGGRHFSAQLD